MVRCIYNLYMQHSCGGQHVLFMACVCVLGGTTCAIYGMYMCAGGGQHLCELALALLFGVSAALFEPGHNSLLLWLCEGTPRGVDGSVQEVHKGHRHTFGVVRGPMHHHPPCTVP